MNNKIELFFDQLRTIHISERSAEFNEDILTTMVANITYLKFKTDRFTDLVTRSDRETLLKIFPEMNEPNPNFETYQKKWFNLVKENLINADISYLNNTFHQYWTSLVLHFYQKYQIGIDRVTLIKAFKNYSKLGEIINERCN